VAAQAMTNDVCRCFTHISSWKNYLYPLVIIAMEMILFIISFLLIYLNMNQWEFQDPKMEVLYHIRPSFVGIFPYIGLTK